MPRGALAESMWCRRTQLKPVFAQSRRDFWSVGLVREVGAKSEVGAQKAHAPARLVVEVPIAHHDAMLLFDRRRVQVGHADHRAPGVVPGNDEGKRRLLCRNPVLRLGAARANGGQKGKENRSGLHKRQCGTSPEFLRHSHHMGQGNRTRDAWRLKSRLQRREVALRRLCRIETESAQADFASVTARDFSRWVSSGA